MTLLDSDTLKKRLCYHGRQYANGQAARGGGQEPHMLEQAANRIDELERALSDLLDELHPRNTLEGSNTRTAAKKALLVLNQVQL